MSDENVEEGKEGKEENETDEEDDLMVELHGLSREELVNQLYGYRRIWLLLDTETQYLLESIGEMFALIRRDYHRIIGTLLKVKFQPATYTVGQYERVYDSTVQVKVPDATNYVWEMKETTILANMILSYEKIHKRDIEFEEEIVEP